MKVTYILANVFLLVIFLPHFLLADTVYLNDGSELKGIVVENYHNHIVLSTFEGEKKIDKDSIKDILYDLREQNLIKLGDFHQDKGNILSAYSYYKKAYEINPNYKQARDKFIYMRSVILRNPQRQLLSDMFRKQALFKESGRIYEPETSGQTITPQDMLREKIGITLYSYDYMPKVASVISKSPASQAGIKEADIIHSIWGRMTGYLELDTVIDMMISSPSPEISLTVKRSVALSRLDSSKHTVRNSGISLYMTEEGLRVQSVRHGSSAAKSGLAEGDLITGINTEPTRYMPLRAAVLKLEENFSSDKLRLDILRDISLWRKEI